MRWDNETVRRAREASQSKADGVNWKRFLIGVAVFVGSLFAVTLAWSVVAALLGLTFEQEQASGPWIALAGAIAITWLWAKRTRGVRRTQR